MIKETVIKVSKSIFRHVGAIVMAGTAILLLLVGIVFFGNYYLQKTLSKKDIVSIPDLTGLTISEASAELRKLSLYLRANDYEYNELDAGMIISQIPARDRLIYANRTIDVVVSRGPKLVLVPPLSGVSMTYIDEYFKALDLKVGTIIQKYSSDVPAGYIIETDPVSGMNIMAGREINIILSIGRDPLDYEAPAIQDYNFWDDDFY
ncbi:MAG: PASTA domain-containing protein [Candidatus Cloacimonetes bacterium]|nr:PASTA domain-containing protein [Candidatus Cloacimonadota bacterium]